MKRAPVIFAMELAAQSESRAKPEPPVPSLPACINFCYDEKDYTATNSASKPSFFAESAISSL